MTIKVNPNFITDEKWEECKNFFNYKCAYCGSETKLYKEHVVPSFKKGLYLPHNIVTACRKCNNSKRNKNMEIWYKSSENFSQKRLDRIYQWVSEQYAYFYENDCEITPALKARMVTYRLEESLLQRIEKAVEVLRKENPYGTISKNSFVAGALEQATEEILKEATPND